MTQIQLSLVTKYDRHREGHGETRHSPKVLQAGEPESWRHHSLLHHPHATAAAEGVSLSIKALQSPDPQSAVGTTTAQRGQLLEFSYEHVRINVH